MLKSELLKLIENLGEEESVNDLLLGTDVEEQILSSALTLDNFKSKASDKEFKAYLDSLNDKHLNSVIKTMKENGTWETQFKDVLEEKYPDLFKIEDPIVKQLREEMDQIKREKAESDKKLAKTQLARDAKGYIKEQYKDFNFDIPDTILERCLADDMDSTKGVVDGLVGFLTETLKADRANYFNNNNPQPPAGPGDPTPKKMSLTEAMQYANEHPEVDVNTLIQ